MTDIQLSENFWLSELIKSDIALRNNVDNTPSSTYVVDAVSGKCSTISGDEIINNLRVVANQILQPCRAQFGPISPTSGYRSPEVNTLVGSKATHSQHILGQAVDFQVVGVHNYNLAVWIKNNLPVYDQLILECYTPGQKNSGWVHCSITSGVNRMQCLTYTHGSYQEGLVE